jgi:hypothetical protein
MVAGGLMHSITTVEFFQIVTTLTDAGQFIAKNNLELNEQLVSNFEKALAILLEVKERA